MLPAILGLAVAGVLLHGALTHQRPAEASSEGILDLPAPPSLPMLRPTLEKTPLTYLSDYYLQLGEQVESKLVRVGRQNLPGLVVTPGVVLTSVRAAEEATSEQLERQALQTIADEGASKGDDSGADAESAVAGRPTIEARSARPNDSNDTPERISLIASDSELGLALFEMPQPYFASAFSPVDPAVLKPGSQVVAVSVLADGRLQVTPGFLSSLGPAGIGADPEPLHVSVAFPNPPLTAALVDLDGRLLGAAFQDGDATRLLSSNRLLQLVDQLREGPACRAIEVADLAEQVAATLGLTSGVLVERVLDEAFSPQPSIRPGDILLQWDGQALSSAEEFQAAYEDNAPGTLVRYEVLRNQRKVAGATVVPGQDCHPVSRTIRVLPHIGLTLKWDQEYTGSTAAPHEGWRVLRVAEGSVASVSGLQAGDLVVALNGLTLTETDEEQHARSLEALAAPLVLTLRRGERVKLIALAPASE